MKLYYPHGYVRLEKDKPVEEIGTNEICGHISLERAKSEIDIWENRYGDSLLEAYITEETRIYSRRRIDVKKWSGK